MSHWNQGYGGDGNVWCIRGCQREKGPRQSGTSKAIGSRRARGRSTNRLIRLRGDGHIDHFFHGKVHADPTRAQGGSTSEGGGVEGTGSLGKAEGKGKGGQPARSGIQTIDVAREAERIKCVAVGFCSFRSVRW